MEQIKRIIIPHSTKTRIITIFTILVIVPFIILSILTFAMLSHYAVSNILDATKDTISMISFQIRSSIKDYEELTMSLYYDGTVELLGMGNFPSSQDEEKIESALQSYCSRSGVRSAYLFAGNSHFYSGEYYPEIELFIESHRNMIKEEHGACIWFPTNELHGNAQETCYILARTLNSKAKEDVGILCIIIDDRMVKNAFSQIKSEYATRYLTTEDGKIIYSSDLNELGKYVDFSEIDPSSKSTVIQTRRLLQGYSALISQKIMRTNWYCIILLDISFFPQNAAKLIVVFLIIVVVYLVFLLFMLQKLNKLIFSPLTKLTQAMDAYAQGELEATQLSPVGSGEFYSISEHFNNMSVRIQELVTHYREEEDEKNRQKMKALTSQLTPHFIYNALNTIKWMALLNHQENIQHLTESLIYIFMNAAKVDDNNYTVEDEIRLIENYAVIQKARFMNFELMIECDEISKTCIIRKFLLQPIVENSIVHGISASQSKVCKIIVKIWADDNLNIIIEDDGIGFDVEKWRDLPQKTDGHSNIGIKSIEEIILLEYGTHYGMQISSEPGNGTKVTYLLPVIRENSDDSNNNS